MTSVLMKRGNLDTDTHIGRQGQRSGEAPTSLQMPHISNKPPEAEGQA